MCSSETAKSTFSTASDPFSSEAVQATRGVGKGGQATIDLVRGKGSGSEQLRSIDDAARAAAAIGGGPFVTKEVFKDDTPGGPGIDVPAAQGAPSQAQSVSAARDVARNRARRRAAASFGRKGTFRTGSGGLQSRPTTTRKTLLGE